MVTWGHTMKLHDTAEMPEKIRKQRHIEVSVDVTWCWNMFLMFLTPIFIWIYPYWFFLTFHSVCVIRALNIFSFKFLEERTDKHLKNHTAELGIWNDWLFKQHWYCSPFGWVWRWVTPIRKDQRKNPVRMPRGVEMNEHRFPGSGHCYCLMQLLLFLRVSVSL